MILLADFIAGIKRENNFGDESVSDDTPTDDILRSINYRCKYITKKTAWDWLIDTFDVTVISGTQDITLDSGIDRLIAIGDNNGDYLRKVSIKDALKWHTPASDEDDTNEIGYFCNLGRDATTGARKVRVFGNPSAAATLPGYGLKVITFFTQANINANDNMLPFPDEIIAVLKSFVNADIERIQQKPEWRADLQLANIELESAISDEQSDPSDDVTSPAPEYYRVRAIMRRSGKVA